MFIGQITFDVNTNIHDASAALNKARKTAFFFVIAFENVAVSSYRLYLYNLRKIRALLNLILTFIQRKIFLYRGHYELFEKNPTYLE